MRQVILLSAFLLLSTVAFCQVYKFKAHSASYKYEGKYGWTKWTEPEETSILIVFNIDKERVTIYSKETQEYDIIKVYDKVVDSDGDDVFRYLCVDKDGLRCNIRWIYLNAQSRWQIYVDYSDMMWVYNVRKID